MPTVDPFECNRWKLLQKFGLSGRIPGLINQTVNRVSMDRSLIKRFIREEGGIKRRKMGNFNQIIFMSYFTVL